jgi:predicted permease
MLEPLPFASPERLVIIENSGTSGLSASTSRTSNVRDFRERAGSFEAIAGFDAFFEAGTYNLVGDGEPERLAGVRVTDDFLDVLGVSPAVGRDFDSDEGVQDGPATVMLTHGLWVRRFGSDPRVVGTSISVNEVPRTVVGVLPESFDFSSAFAPTASVDLLLPWPISDQTDRSGNSTTMVARLAPGATVETAQAELERIMSTLSEEDHQRWGLGARTTALQERLAAPFRTGMLLLAAAAALVMSIVCVNLSNMLLARSPRRRREMAVRSTLGATRSRLVRQLLVENLTVALAGALVGAVIALVATRFVAGNGALDIPMLSAVRIDGTALVFTVVVALLAGLVVGAIPALQISSGAEAKSLGGSSRGASIGRGHRRLREVLVVAQVAMACVLLVFGGLVLKSFQRVMDVELGFEPAGATAWQVATSRRFANLPEASSFYAEVAAAVEAVPGVDAVGLVDALPLGWNRTWGTRVVGVDYAEGEGVSFFPHVVGPGYLNTMGIPLVEGRGILPTDDGESAPVAVVNETAARTMFPDGRALGRFFQMRFGEVEIVGVVPDVRHRGRDIEAGNEVYFSMAQVWDFNTIDVVVRSSLPTTSLIGPVGQAIRTVDPRMPTDDFRSLDAVVEQSVSPRRFTLQLLGAFASCALLLAGLGIYGVLSYSVTERIPEIGIRMALGESAAEVRRSVVGQTAILAVLGVAIGTVISLLGTRLVASLLFGVEPTDLATFATTIGVLLGVALLSGLVPAIRASHIESATALRSG